VEDLATTAPQAEKVLIRERRITAGYSGPGLMWQKRPRRAFCFHSFSANPLKQKWSGRQGLNCGP
jgi:hypothetical protein